MALDSKKSLRTYTKTDTNSRLYITAAQHTAMSASYAAGEHIEDMDFLDGGGKSLLYQINTIIDDIDELRRFGTGSGEISVDGGAF